jgi:mRNA-degrading endonuclease toxin of MazEF toxin-antitoxin module
MARWHDPRPVLVLTRDAILEYLGDVTVAPLTSTIRAINVSVPFVPSVA